MLPTLSQSGLATIIASRFVLNAIFRIAYPLVPFIATRYGVTVEQATWIVTIQVASGLICPLGGWLGDRVGYRPTMALGAGLVLAGALLAAAAPSLALLVVAFGACGVGISIYQPAMQAYVSVMTPFGARGRAIGLVELSWALAGIAAVPPLMWLVGQQSSITGVFLILSGALATMFVVSVFGLPEVAPQLRPQAVSEGGLAAVLRDRNVLGMFGFVFLALGGVEMLYIVQAPWAAERFAASPADLGFVALIFGVGELLGSIGSTLITDRLGKRRAATLSFGLAAICYLLLPLLSVSWISYLLCFFVFAIFVEFGIVAALTFASTVSLTNRATVMALTVTATQVSRAIASRLGVPLLESSSLLANGIVAALLTLAGIAIVRRFSREVEQA